MPDGGAGADAGSALTDGCMSAPAPPEPPRLADWSCPAGWGAVAAHEVPSLDLAAGVAPAVKVCAPPALPQGCPDGQRAAVGSAACQVVGDPCPAGDFPPAPASGPLLWVKAGAVGGNGQSAAAPFGTIVQAVSAAAAGTTILIAKGTYSEYVPLTRAVTLWGACAQETIITSPTRSSARGTIDIGVAATIKNLQVSGPRPGVWVSFTAELAKVQGVIVKGAELAGVFVSDNGRVQLDDVLITGTRADPADGTLGRGLQVRTGGQVRGSGLTVEQNRDVGVTVDGAGCIADLTDLVVRDTQSETASRAFGLGMEVRYGAQANVRQAVFERNRNSALVGDKAGTRLSLSDVVLQDTLPQENNGQYGGGLEVAAGATVDLSRVVIRRNRATGMRVGGATVTAADLAVLETAPRASDSTQGLGLVMDLAAQVTLERAVFAGNRIADGLVSDRGTRLSLTDVRLRGVRSQASDGKWGIGLIAMSEALVVASRVSIERTDDSGAQLQGKAVGTFADLVVRDTGFGGALTSGDGLAIQSAAQATVTRSAFQNNKRIAVGVHGGSVVQLTDWRVSDVGTDRDGYFGRGLALQAGAIGSVTRAEVSRAREAALYVHGSQSRLSLDQVTVLDTQAAAQGLNEGRAISAEAGSLTDATCLLARGSREVAANANGTGTRLNLRRVRLVETTGIENFGDGVAASQGATVTIEDAEIGASQTLGVAFAGAQGTLKRTKIFLNGIGLYAGEGATVKEVEQLSATVAPLEVQVETSCAFEGNKTRVAGDFVPLPGGVAPAPSRPEL